MDDRDAMLNALPPGTGGVLPPVYERGKALSDELWLEFEQRLLALGGQMIPLEALPLVLSRGYWADQDVPLDLPLSSRAASVWEAEVGLCVADLAISETGSLAIAAGPGRGRLTSLAPPVNLVLIAGDRIVAGPEEAFARLQPETTVIVTGTSRTADIEGVLVRGVHGPRELYVTRLT